MYIQCITMYVYKEQNKTGEIFFSFTSVNFLMFIDSRDDLNMWNILLAEFTTGNLFPVCKAKFCVTSPECGYILAATLLYGKEY